jgi:MFS transporter, SP family, solute carrier family 2 (myo-inositol transporter), member 13
VPNDPQAGYNRFLLLVAGLGGLLYGVDVGIIAGALPYLEATSGLNAGQLSMVVAAVLLGSVISTLFAGTLADWMGRKPLMTLSGVTFVVSIPIIALSHGYGPLVLGRLLQGISAGLIGVVVPLYLAECLSASQRGKGTGVFQWLLTLGIVTAAVVGMSFSIRVEEVAKLGDPSRLFAFKDASWRSIFWVSLPPGILFVIGSFLVSESPRWLFRRGQRDAAYAALLRSRTKQQADLELAEMQQAADAQRTKTSSGSQARESLLRRKYVIPFLLACVILACNQATGVNSIIGYNANILLQSGLSDVEAHWGYVLFTVVNFLMTMGGIALVDRKGRKFLLSLGSAGIIVSLLCTGFLFRRTESLRVDVRAAVQATVSPDEKLTLRYDEGTAGSLLASAGDRSHGKAIAVSHQPTSLIVIYSCGDFRAATKVVRSDDSAARPIEVTRESCLPANKVVAFFSNPFSDLEASGQAPLKIDNALISPVPDAHNGWMVALTLFVFMAFYAIGPGVCVWLALSELMPTRIRSNGMSIALLLNQAVSTGIAATFLPTVGKYGYATMFFAFSACTVIYFVTAAFFLPETKGKTLEEIEAHFEGMADKPRLTTA